MNTTLAKKISIAALLAIASFSPAFIPETHADTRISIGANIGFRLPNGAVTLSVGDHRYHYHDGRYFKKTPRGYVSVRAPRGAKIRKLPRGYSKIIAGGRTYYRHGAVYYVRQANHYIVVDKPDVVVEETDTSAPTTTYTVWVDGERELVMKNGQFFRKSPEGLIWVDLPAGAIASELPADFETIWYQEIEYFEKDGVHFKKTPAGYQVILPPWESE